MQILDIKELKAATGLRIVLVAGTPSPWGQTAKAMIEYKGLAYTTGWLSPGEVNQGVVNWSGVNSGPVVAWDDEEPINRWNDILFLLERLAPFPALIPEDGQGRADFFGMCHELCGELGLGWNRRLMAFAPIIDAGDAPEGITRMGAKYNYNKADAELAADRVVETLNLLAKHLSVQRSAGSNFFIGNAPTALDFYWAGFSNLIEVMSWEKIPVREDLRPLFAQNSAAIAAAFTPILREHRDQFFDRYFKSPMEF